MISKSCKYAFRAAIYITSKADGNIKLGVKEIAKEIDAPQAFTGKILQMLKKHQIISSLKGPYGGFYCEKHQLNLPIINIVNAVDGLSVFEECILGLNQCTDTHPCPMHSQYMKTRENMLKSFEETTMANLAESLKSGSVYITSL